MSDTPETPSAPNAPAPPLPRFRCYNPKCSEGQSGPPGYDFEAARAVCPKCGAGADPRTARLITKLATVHFDPPTEFHGIGKGYPACRPDKTIKGIKASGVHDAVTCKACRESAEFQESYAAARAWDEADYEVEIDVKNGTVRPKG